MYFKLIFIVLDSLGIKVKDFNNKDISNNKAEVSSNNNKIEVNKVVKEPNNSLNNFIID